MRFPGSASANPPALRVLRGLSLPMLVAAALLDSPCAAQCFHGQETGHLFGSIFNGNDYIGTSVAVSGDTAVIGAPGDDGFAGAVSAGAVYVHTRTGGVWSLQAKVEGTNLANDDLFGQSVAISGDTMAVGASGDNNGALLNAGSVYIFTRVGTVWTQQAILLASDSAANNGFGSSVALMGDVLIIGAPQNNNANGTFAGAAYIFNRSGGVWTQTTKLIASDGAGGDAFGASVAITAAGTRLNAIVGAWGNNNAGGANAGAAYVFNITPVQIGSVWTERAKLLASDGTGGTSLGTSVAISGSTALVGGPGQPGGGAAYIFTSNITGSTWTQQAKLTPSDPPASNGFGSSVALAGSLAVIGSPVDTAAGPGTGAAYVFTRTSASVWPQQVKLLMSDRASGDRAGASIALAGDTVVVGADRDDALNWIDGGSAYVFHAAFCPADFDCDGQVAPSDIAAFVATWSTSVQSGTLAGDFDGNGVVNPADIGAFVNTWFNALTTGC